WSGTDGLSGTGQTVTKAYATVGTKTGSVTVTGSSGGSRTIDCTNSVAVTPCYGQGCSCQGCDGGGGCDYPPPPAQPNTITPSKCCSPTSGVCPVPPTVTLAADPTETYEGKTSELSWESSSDSGVDYCTWTGSYFTPAKTTTHGRKNDGTSTTTRPLLIDMNFGITCTGTNGLTSDVVTVPITVHGPDLSITADPERVPAGSASTIKWSANYVKYCTVTNSSDPGHTLAQGSTKNGKFEDGLEKVTINGQSIFTINCDSFNEAKPKEIKSVIVNILPLFQEF
ncbi:MAG: hypothetical protein NTY93_01010, partial [Candidatus Kaiserbacteria bacterium]|nr:hypothetical protein [Candidatus Kaiserbacteria bacterium]